MNSIATALKRAMQEAHRPLRLATEPDPPTKEESFEASVDRLLGSLTLPGEEANANSSESTQKESASMATKTEKDFVHASKGLRRTFAGAAKALAEAKGLRPANMYITDTISQKELQSMLDKVNEQLVQRGIRPWGLGKERREKVDPRAEYNRLVG